MSWFSRGAMRNQYETGVIKATYGYTDINNNLRVAQDAAGPTTSTYDGDNLRRKIVAGSVTTTFVWDGSDYLQIKPSTGDATLLVLLEGEVVGHVKGSEKRDYIVDPLGSVVAYLNSSQTLTDQFEYWPYGEMVAEIEAGTEPFLWVGSLGYFRDSDLRTYIRAREYRQDLGSWMQLDPLWPWEPAHVYSGSTPAGVIDPSGLQTTLLPSADFFERVGRTIRTQGIVLFSCSPIGQCFQCLRSAANATDAYMTKVEYSGPKGNAIRHCIWACKAAKTCSGHCLPGVDMKEFLDLIWEPITTGRRVDVVDSRVDWCNNERGFGLKSEAQCTEACEQAWKAGNLCTASDFAKPAKPTIWEQFIFPHRFIG